MTELDPGLLAAIIADRDDDLPRLQMADWLDERGECDRAELIRKQIALDRMPHDRRRGIRWIQAVQAVNDIMEEFEDAWSPPIGGFINEHEWTWGRGFPVALMCSARDWCRNADWILESAPLERLTLTSWPRYYPANCDGGPGVKLNFRNDTRPAKLPVGQLTAYDVLIAYWPTLKVRFDTFRDSASPVIGSHGGYPIVDAGRLFSGQEAAT